MATETKALLPYEAFRSDLKRMEGQIAPLLPQHVSIDRFTRVLLTAIQRRPELLQCPRPLLWQEVMVCASDGLVPDAREAIINVFGAKKGNPTPKYIPMVGGICKKARNSGEIKSIDALVVYENDIYKSWIDENGQHFKHEKALKDRGNPILTYAYALITTGGFFFEEINEDQMEAIEASSRAQGDDSPWKGPFKDEMRRKSVLHRLLKYRVPSSADLDRVFERENDLYNAGEDSSDPSTLQAMPASEPKKPENKPSRLSSIVGAQTISQTTTPAQGTQSASQTTMPPQGTTDEQVPI